MFYPHLNQPDRANEVYEISREYLLGHEDLTNRIQDHLRARYEVNDVVTETAPKLESGHFFPFLESYTELELSLSLALLGFYRHAFDSLRSSFELCVAGVYYCLLYTSDAADDLLCVDLGGRRIITKKKKKRKH